jgi:hypothetical protein
MNIYTTDVLSLVTQLGLTTIMRVAHCVFLTLCSHTIRELDARAMLNHHRIELVINFCRVDCTV